MKVLAEQRTAGHVPRAKADRFDEDYQLALAMSLSQRDADESLTRKKRKLDDDDDEHERDMCVRTMNVVSLANEIEPIDHNEDLLKQTTEAIERFMNRARSNCK